MLDLLKLVKNPLVVRRIDTDPRILNPNLQGILEGASAHGDVASRGEFHGVA